MNKIEWELTRTFPLCSNAKTHNRESSLGVCGPTVGPAGSTSVHHTLNCSSPNSKWEALRGKCLLGSHANSTRAFGISAYHLLAFVRLGWKN